MVQIKSMSEAGRATKPTLPQKPIFMVTAKTGCFGTPAALLSSCQLRRTETSYPSSPAVRLGTRTQPDLPSGLVPAFQAQLGEPNVPTPTDVFLFSRSPSKSN